jgi:hypothetical protein
MSTLIERLTELGFDNDDGRWRKNIGSVVVQVETVKVVWVPAVPGSRGHSEEQPTLEYQIHMHHSCDEWVIANDEDPAFVIQRTLEFSTDVAEAAALLAQVVA